MPCWAESAKSKAPKTEIPGQATEGWCPQATEGWCLKRNSWSRTVHLQEDEDLHGPLVGPGVALVESLVLDGDPGQTEGGVSSKDLILEQRRPAPEGRVLGPELVSVVVEGVHVVFSFLLDPVDDQVPTGRKPAG